jgi:hypothetical protein
MVGTIKHQEVCTAVATDKPTAHPAGDSELAQPEPGDVVSVDYADPDPEPKGRMSPFGRSPKPDERVAIRLHQHPYTYVVRVTASRHSGPKLTELMLIADDGHTVDYEALRTVPVRRLAFSARQWIARNGGKFAAPGDYRQTQTQPENADPQLTELAWRIEYAVMNGEPVRKTVAADLGVNLRKLDRMIARAKAEGLLDGVVIPRRPQPQQRDALRARHEAELWLDTHRPTTS